MGSGCGGKALWLWFVLEYVPFPFNPKWRPEGINHLTKAYVKYRRGGEENAPNTLNLALECMPNLMDVPNFQTKAGQCLQREGMTGERLKGSSAFSSPSPTGDDITTLTNIHNSLSVAVSIKILSIWPQFYKMEGCWINVTVFHRSFDKRGKYLKWCTTSDQAIGDKKYIICLKIRCKSLAAFQYIQTPLSHKLFWESAFIN